MGYHLPWGDYAVKEIERRKRTGSFLGEMYSAVSL